MRDVWAVWRQGESSKVRGGIVEEKGKVSDPRMLWVYILTLYPALGFCLALMEGG
jgi:hypothetical protein